MSYPLYTIALDVLSPLEGGRFQPGPYPEESAGDSPLRDAHTDIPRRERRCLPGLKARVSTPRNR
jgi:hypothetical protein